MFSTTTNIDINQNIEKTELLTPDREKSPKQSDIKHSDGAPLQTLHSAQTSAPSQPLPSNTLSDNIDKTIKDPGWKIDQVIRKMSVPLIDSKVDDDEKRENGGSNLARTPEPNTHHNFENKAFIDLDGGPFRADDRQHSVKDRHSEQKDEVPMFENNTFIEVSCNNTTDKSKQDDKRMKTQKDFLTKKKSVIEETFDIIAEGEKTMSNILNDRDEVKQYSPVYKKEREELFKTTNTLPEKEDGTQVYKSSVDFELSSDPPTFHRFSMQFSHL